MSTIIQGPQVRTILAGVRIEKSATTVINGDADLFTISGGRVLITNLIGEVTTVISGTTPTLLVKNVTTVGGDVSLATATTVTDDEVGTLYAVDGVGNALETGSSGVVESSAKGIVCAEGTLKMTSAAADVAGAVSWTMTYVPLDDGASVASA